MSKNIKKIILIMIIFSLILIEMSMIVKAEDTDLTNKFSLSNTELNVTLNGTRFLNINNKPTGETVTWTSSDETVATVQNGTVSGLKIGTTTITATTSGGQTATCEVTVVYAYLLIESNKGNSISTTNLVLGEHPTETLTARVQDGNFVDVQNAVVTWKSSNSSVATVDNNGKVTAVSAGTATITAETDGVSDTCEITVAAAPVFTDFSNAKYELLFDTNVDLKITGVTPIEKNNYYYIITDNNTKPTITIDKYGGLDTEETVEAEGLICNTDENYIYDRNLDKYVELNQDLYIWIIEDVRLGASYTENGENYVSHATRFVVEGQKLARPQLPQLNLILKSIFIWGGEGATEDNSYIHFRFPSAVENRKFKLKIGKVTDNSILKKIQNNDYSGITELLQYAKNNQAIYTADLTTTSENYYRNDESLFDGVKLLENKAYYYIYVEFDNENGKYYPIEGITLGQALIGVSKEHWGLYAYTADNFEWNDLSSTGSEDNLPKDETISKNELPNTGAKMVGIILIVAITGTTVFFKVKNNKYKEI